MADTPGQPAKDERTLLTSTFSQAVLGVLFGLTLKKALEVGCDKLLGPQPTTIAALTARIQTAPWDHLFGFLQLLAFLATLCRFYVGAHRFHQERPKQPKALALVLDSVWTVLLFVFFFVAAILVGTTELFFYSVLVFHLVDTCWFVASPSLSDANPKYLSKVVSDYLLYDFLTVLAFGVVAIRYHVVGFPANQLQLYASLILGVMFVLDVFIKTRDWYFLPDAWKAKHGT